MSNQNIDSENGGYVRRTITISPRINQTITNFRIQLMSENPNMEYDYTTVANALMAYGIIFVEKYERGPEDDKQVVDIVGSKFRLAEFGMGDAIEHLRRMQYEESIQTEPESNSVEGKKKEDVPETE